MVARCQSNDGACNRQRQSWSRSTATERSSRADQTQRGLLTLLTGPPSRIHAVTLCSPPPAGAPQTPAATTSKCRPISSKAPPSVAPTQTRAPTSSSTSPASAPTCPPSRPPPASTSKHSCNTVTRQPPAATKPPRPPPTSANAYPRTRRPTGPTSGTGGNATANWRHPAAPG